MILDNRILYFLERHFLAGNAVFSRRGKWAMKKENGTERWTDPCHDHAAHAMPIFQRYCMLPNPVYYGKQTALHDAHKSKFLCSLRCPPPAHGVCEGIQDTKHLNDEEISRSVVRFISPLKLERYSALPPPHPPEVFHATYV